MNVQESYSRALEHGTLLESYTMLIAYLAPPPAVLVAQERDLELSVRLVAEGLGPALGAHLQDGLDEDPEVWRGDAVLPLVLLVQDGLLHLLERLPGGARPAAVLPVREERGQAVEDVPAATTRKLVILS